MDNMDTSFDEFFDAFDGGDDGNQTDTVEEVEETEPAEETTEEPGGEAQEEPESDEPAEEVTEEEAEEGGAEGDDKAEKNDPEQKFTIKVNKESREVGITEMTELAQKGADYDRVKGQLESERQSRQELQAKFDEQQETMEILNMVSEATGKPISELLEHLHVAAVKKEGQTDAEVKAQIRAEKAERKLKASQEQQAKQQTAAEENATRAQREIAEFREQFPDAQLTKEVLDKLMPDVQKGMSLTNAYLKYENARLAAEIRERELKEAAAAQNKRNRAKSPGSQKDVGGKHTHDAYDDFFGAFEK